MSNSHQRQELSGRGSKLQSSFTNESLSEYVVISAPPTERTGTVCASQHTLTSICNAVLHAVPRIDRSQPFAPITVAITALNSTVLQIRYDKPMTEFTSPV